MTVATVVKNLRPATETVRRDLREYARARARRERTQLSEAESRWLSDLRRDGYAVVNDYWPRERALELRDTLEAYLEEGKSRDFDNGAYLRFWDDRPYDQGVRRIYHVERLIPELADHRHDPSILKVASEYYSTPFHSGVLVFQHNTQWNEGTRFYHVDIFDKEFKTFLYLDDVDAGNGPFAYLRGTHRSWGLRLRKMLKDGKQATGFSEDEIASVLDREVQIEAPAGTLILVDVRGIHRGSPQVERSRSVLVNYMYTHAGDAYLDTQA